MKWKRLLLFAAVIVSGMGLLMFIKVPTLSIASEGSVQKLYLYEDQMEFKVRWQHSVEKQEWEEIFLLQEGGIELTGTRFQTFGAGVPHDAGKHTFIKDGWVYMTGISQRIGKQLLLRTGEDTNHQVIYGKDAKFELEKNQAYQLTVGHHSLLNSVRYYISGEIER